MDGDTHLRVRDGSEQKTTTLELFFDLIYVFAVTQLSHLVIDGELGLVSVERALFLLVVVWWAWIYTTWMVNWFDPESGPVRGVLTVAGLASLLMAAAIPQAFTVHGLLFATSYVVLQVGRNAAATLLLSRTHALRRVFGRNLVWSVLAGAWWIAGGVAHGHVRVVLWLVALAVDLAAPLVGYRTPGLGQSQTSDWEVEGGHFAERFQLFIIIALGESVVVTGATASERGLDGDEILALALAFLVTAALWWLYFGEVARMAQLNLAESEDPGRIARDAYTYLHLPIAAGIIMTAIADDVLISAPLAHPSSTAVLMAALGPAVYLLGESLVRLRMVGRVSRKRLTGLGALVALAAVGTHVSAAALTASVAGVLALLSAWEHEPLRLRVLGLVQARRA